MTGLVPTLGAKNNTRSSLVILDVRLEGPAPPDMSILHTSAAKILKIRVPRLPPARESYQMTTCIHGNHIPCLHGQHQMAVCLL